MDGNNANGDHRSNPKTTSINGNNANDNYQSNPKTPSTKTNPKTKQNDREGSVHTASGSKNQNNEEVSVHTASVSQIHKRDFSFPKEMPSDAISTSASESSNRSINLEGLQQIIMNRTWVTQKDDACLILMQAAPQEGKTMVHICFIDSSRATVPLSALRHLKKGYRI